jgi:glutamine amidotransferase/cyclase
MQVYILDYGAGNVKSVENALLTLGFNPKYITQKSDFAKADKIIFPGVGQFGQAMNKLNSMGLTDDLIQYINQNRPFMGICVGMQLLYDGSEESSVNGLGVIRGKVLKFNNKTKSVPQIGWNQAMSVDQNLEFTSNDKKYYFIHSYAVIRTDINEDDWAGTLTTYGDETFVSSVRKGNCFATQFHPEKSGIDGLKVFESFLNSAPLEVIRRSVVYNTPKDMLSKRIIACLDVRTNDKGDLVVTKGDQYDVREAEGDVRNLGKPVDLAKRYYDEGADEITFLNITSFRSMVLEDNLMLQVLRETSKKVFVPLTIGGGIRDIEVKGGKTITALEVAGEYFRSGADKVSIGSDAVYIAEKFIRVNQKFENAISAISDNYGAQAVVISVDPKRVYVNDPKDTIHNTVETFKLGPNGERFW